MPKPSANAVYTPLSRPLAAFAAAALLGCIPYGNTLCWECADGDEECKKNACPSYTESDTATASDSSTTTETGTTTSTMTTSTTSMTTTSTTTDTTTTDDTTTSTTTGGPCNYDLACDADEDADDCLHDCGVCEENGVCDGATETPYSCPADCPASGCNSDGSVDALTEQCDDGNAEDGDACTSECAHAACGDGYLFAVDGGTEECDDGNLVDGDGCASDCTIEHRTVFVTSDKYDGNLGGLAGADALCQGHAEAAELGGTFMAWLSVGGDDATGPSDRFGIDSEFSGVFELVDGTEIAVGWPDLVDGGLAHAIDMDETSVTVGSSAVWTNTGVDGTPQGTSDCGGWTAAVLQQSGSVGTSDAMPETPDWTYVENVSAPCNTSARLYCFQVQ